MSYSLHDLPVLELKQKLSQDHTPRSFLEQSINSARIIAKDKGLSVFPSTGTHYNVGNEVAKANYK